jgi:hypothetical protein
MSIDMLNDLRIRVDRATGTTLHPVPNVEMLKSINYVIDKAQNNSKILSLLFAYLKNN